MSGSPPGHDCGSCAAGPATTPGRAGRPGRGGRPGRPAGLERRGLAVRGADVVVALAGNPNSGKTTLFNALTGLRQRVGNWPGTTVSRAEGGYRHGGLLHRVVDLPGSTSLTASGGEESVARDFLVYSEPDVCVVVVDATRLERHLYLVLQVLAVTRRVVVALNMVDEAVRSGIVVDERHLARELGVPVVPVVARTGEGLARLLAEVGTVALGAVPRGPSERRLDAAVEAAARAVADDLEKAFPGVSRTRWWALRLLEGDTWTEAAVRQGEVPVAVSRS